MRLTQAALARSVLYACANRRRRIAKSHLAVGHRKSHVRARIRRAETSGVHSCSPRTATVHPPPDGALETRSPTGNHGWEIETTPVVQLTSVDRSPKAVDHRCDATRGPPSPMAPTGPRSIATGFQPLALCHPLRSPQMQLRAAVCPNHRHRMPADSPRMLPIRNRRPVLRMSPNSLVERVLNRSSSTRAANRNRALVTICERYGLRLALTVHR